MADDDDVTSDYQYDTVTSEVHEFSKEEILDARTGAVLSRFEFTYPPNLNLSNHGNSGKTSGNHEVLVDEDGDLLVPRKGDVSRKTGVVIIEHQQSTSLELVGEQVWRGALFLADYLLYCAQQHLEHKQQQPCSACKNGCNGFNAIKNGCNGYINGSNGYINGSNDYVKDSNGYINGCNGYINGSNEAENVCNEQQSRCSESKAHCGAHKGCCKIHENTCNSLSTNSSLSKNSKKNSYSENDINLEININNHAENSSGTTCNSGLNNSFCEQSSCKQSHTCGQSNSSTSSCGVSLPVGVSTLDIRKARVLELASGVGMTAIVAGMLAEAVVVTDLDLGNILRLIQGNVSRNSDLLGCPVLVRELNFCRLDTVEKLERQGCLDGVDVILAADVVYNNSLTDSFFAAVHRIMSRPPSKLLLVALEKRYVFTLADLDTVAPCYEYFLQGLDKLQQCRLPHPAAAGGGCSGAVTGISWKVEQVDVGIVPQYFAYEKTDHLVLWQIKATLQH